MKEVFTLYLQAGFFGSVIILLILLLRVILRKAPRRILCVLWLLAAVRLLLPFSLESQLSLQPRYEPPEITDTVVQQMDTPINTPDISADPDTQIIDGSAQSNIQQTHRPVDHMQLLSFVWVSVAAAALLYTWVSYIYLKHRVRESVKCDNGVMENEKIHGAFLLGYLKPGIYLPAGLNARDRQFILAHERAHIARGDNWWKLLGFICACLHWYNPLVWLGYALLCRDIEIACDEQVVQDMELEERKAYSLALLNCGKSLSGLSACPVAFGEVSLKQRIKNVLSYRKPGMWITVAAVALVVVVAVCFLTTPETDSPGAGEETEQTQPSGTGAATETVSEEATEPSTTSAEETTEEPTEETTEETTETSPQVSTTAPTEAPTTAPTQPSTPQETQPQPDNPSNTLSAEQTDIIAGDDWDGGPVTWQITSDGTLTISGNTHIQGSQNYIWKQYSNMITKIVIEDGITTIPEYAFSDMTNVTSVYLSNTLKIIRQYAFWNCTALKSVTIPVNVTEISSYAFFGCSSLTTLQFTSSCKLNTIGESAFSKSGVTQFTAPSSLRVIDYDAFNECKSLNSVTLRGGVEEVRASAFNNCTNLKNLVLGESLIRVGGGVFNGCYAIEHLEIYTNALFGDFENRTALTSVVIGGNVTSLNSWFAGCSALSNVTISAPITEIGGFAFKDCTSLTSFTIPDSVSTIDSHAFNNSGLTKITIPASVKKLGIAAFLDCSLQEIIFLGDAPTFTNSSAFSGVVATAYYPANNSTWTKDKLKDYGGTIIWVAV